MDFAAFGMEDHILDGDAGHGMELGDLGGMSQGGLRMRVRVEDWSDVAEEETEGEE